MARDFIHIDRSQSAATEAQTLLAYKNALRVAYELGKKVLGVMNHNNDGSVWTDVETLFGIPTGKGNTVYDLINGSVGAMEGSFQNSNAKDLTETVG